MKITQICQKLYCISAEERNLRTYRNESYTEHGMRYASYAIETEDGWITLGSLPERFTEEWIHAVSSLSGENGVKWSVFFGVEGDLAAWQAVQAVSNDATAIVGESVLHSLSALDGSKFQSLLIRTTRKLRFGEKELTFHIVTDNHQVPSLYVIDHENGVLINADAFGADCAIGVERLSQADRLDEYLHGAALYFADIYGRRRHKAMGKAVELVRSNAIKIICPAFGPVVDCSLDRLLAIYEQPVVAEKGKPILAIAYLPEQGVDQLAKEIAAGARERREINVSLVDLSAGDRDRSLACLEKADCILLGVPSQWGDAPRAVWDMLIGLKQGGGKYAAVFHTGGIDSTIPAHLRTRLETLGFNTNVQDFFTTGLPVSSDRDAAQDYGFGMACLMLGVPNPRKPTLVKCLICGEIFDASLGICPVCGVGLDQCVPVDADEVMFRRDSQMRYVIVGGGTAAVSAAEAIRQRDETGSILMLSAERELPINRPMLTKNLDELEADPEALLIHPETWFQERNIDVRLGVSVTEIQTEEKQLRTDSRETFFYDKLIYAAGAECFIPPMQGSDKKGVLTLRHMDDAKALAAHLRGAKNAVIIGGGAIGIEAASEIVSHGIHVTVLEVSPQIIGRQADAASAASLRSIMKKMGVDCLEGVSIQEIYGDAQVRGVRLADGQKIPGDCLILSCGVRANVGPIKEAGARINRAVVVNAHMETSLEDVYACGDCAELDGLNYQLWPEATKQGKIAGANAAGDCLIYTHELLGLSLEGFGASFYAIGDPGKKEGVPYKMVEIKDQVRNRQEKYWYVGERLEGAILIQAPEKIAQASQAVAGHFRYTDING